MEIVVLPRPEYPVRGDLQYQLPIVCDVAIRPIFVEFRSMFTRSELERPGFTGDVAQMGATSRVRSGESAGPNYIYGLVDQGLFYTLK